MAQVTTSTIAWTSSTGGSYSGTVILNGVLLGVTFKPDSGGTQPTDLYDVVINDSLSVDILAGLGANLSNSTTTTKCPMIAATDGTTTTASYRPLAGSHTVSVSNAGSAKGGTIQIYYR